MKLEKGKQYECIEDVVMSSGRVDYTKGQVYTCENEGCLTDKTGDEFHSWDESEAKRYFKPYGVLPKVETITKSEALRILKKVKGVDVIIEG